MDQAGVAQVRIIPSYWCREKFAEYIYSNINEFVKAETDNRVSYKVKFMEHGKNAAYYSE